MYTILWLVSHLLFWHQTTMFASPKQRYPGNTTMVSNSNRSLESSHVVRVHDKLGSKIPTPVCPSKSIRSSLQSKIGIHEHKHIYICTGYHKSFLIPDWYFAQFSWCTLTYYTYIYIYDKSVYDEYHWSSPHPALPPPQICTVNQSKSFWTYLNSQYQSNHLFTRQVALLPVAGWGWTAVFLHMNTSQSQWYSDLEHPLKALAMRRGSSPFDSYLMSSLSCQFLSRKKNYIYI